MSFDYSKLRGRIVERYGTQIKFAQALHITDKSLSLKLNNGTIWRQDEIEKSVELLEIEPNLIHQYFFTPMVQQFEPSG